MIIAAEPNPRHATFITVTVQCPIGAGWHEHNVKATGLGRLASGRHRAAPCGSQVTTEDRAGGYYLSDPADVITGLPVTPNRSAR